MQNPFKIGSLDYDNWNYEHPNDARDVVAEAKGSLAKANQLTAETGSDRLAKLPASLAALRQPMDTRGPVRRITEPLAEGGSAALLAGVPTGMVNPAIGGALLAGGGLATFPDYLRKMIAPEGDEERPGVVESGMEGLMLLPTAASLRGLRALSAAAPELEPGADLAREVVKTARGYQAEGQSMKQAGQRAGWPLGKSAEVPYQQLAEQPIRPSELFPYQSEEIQNGISPFKKMSRQGAFQGDRTTGAFEEGPSGLTALTEGRLKPYPMPDAAKRLADLSRVKPPSDETYLRAVRSGGRYGPGSTPRKLPGVQ